MSIQNVAKLLCCMDIQHSSTWLVQFQRCQDLRCTAIFIVLKKEKPISLLSSFLSPCAESSWRLIKHALNHKYVLITCRLLPAQTCLCYSQTSPDGLHLLYNICPCVLTQCTTDQWRHAHVPVGASQRDRESVYVCISVCVDVCL